MWQEWRVASRQILRWPGGALAAVVTLTLGVAASTAMFALVDGVVLRPLPVRDQSSLALLSRQLPTASDANVPFTARDIDALNRSSRRTLNGVAGVAWTGAGPVAVLEDGRAASLRLVHVTGSFFDVLG